MTMTPKERDSYLLEALDPRKISIFCGLHDYHGPSKTNKEIKPFKNCSRCWFVFYLHDIASTPPHLRAERLSELEEVINHATELADKGKFDFEPYRHPKIEIGSE